MDAFVALAHQLEEAQAEIERLRAALRAVIADPDVADCIAEAALAVTNGERAPVGKAAAEYADAQRRLLEAARERARAIARLQEADDNLMEVVRELEALETTNGDQG